MCYRHTVKLATIKKSDKTRGFSILILYWQEYKFSICTLDSNLPMSSNIEDVPILLYIFIDIPPIETIIMCTNLPLKLLAKAPL